MATTDAWSWQVRTVIRVVIGACVAVLALLAFAASDTPRTIEGRVDGQKFGTNVLGDGVSVNFVADSDEESRLLDACNVGERCRVVVVTRPGDVVARLISAVRVGAAAPPPDGATSGPSFSCRKASTKVEHLICADPTISALDRALAARFREQLDANPERRKSITQQQRDWIGAVRSKCDDKACLSVAYRARISELSR